MKFVKIENVSPDYSVRDIMESGGEVGDNAFFWVDTYHADITLNFNAGPVKFSNVRLYQFARALMTEMFFFNFYEMDRVQIELSVYADVLFTVESTQNGIDILIEPFYGQSILFNNVQHKFRDPVLIQTGILEFNRICGALFGQTLEILDDKFEGIDGVEDFFGTISFSEGFQESWKDFD